MRICPVIACLAITTLLVSCGGDKPKEKKLSNIVIYHTIGEPDGMHPVNDNSGPRTEVNTYTQVFMVNTDVKNNQPMPYLAAALPVVSEDGKTYTYTLRSGIKWDDGSPVTSEDVLFTFKANKCPLANNPHAKPYLDNILDIKTDGEDKAKMVFTMKDKYIQNVWMLTDFPIMQRKFFDPDDVLSKYTFQQFDDKNFKADKENALVAWTTEFNSPKYSHDLKFIAGAGPYKITGWEPGQTMTLEKKKNHWSEGKSGMYETAGPDKIVITINREPNSYMLEFKKQKYDASTYIEIKALMELEKSKDFTDNYNYAFLPTYSYSYLAINMKPDGVKHKKLFNDVKVRWALSMLTPVDDINKVIYKGKAKRQTTCISPLKPDYNQDLKPIEFDVEGAKKLLVEAGWKDSDGDGVLEKKIDGETVKMEFNIQYMATAPSWKDIAFLTAESFYKAGIKATPVAVDFNVALDNLKNHDFDILVSAWQGVAAPEDHEQIWSTKSWANKGSNFTGWGNAQTDALIDSMKHELDEGKRAVMSKRFQKMIYDDQPYIFLFSSVRRIAIHKRFGKQEMYYDRQAILLNQFQLTGASSKPSLSN
ncbi:MAG TPA: ABC transporter substrate-binding protein [Bacteroidia bacterium]|jgi:peptide/nickel transport system substrate-binding protein|nr:ABC transporter substrate-binding protein [Bacteroidia bacterium]